MSLARLWNLELHEETKILWHYIQQMGNIKDDLFGCICLPMWLLTIRLTCPRVRVSCVAPFSPSTVISKHRLKISSRNLSSPICLIFERWCNGGGRFETTRLPYSHRSAPRHPRCRGLILDYIVRCLESSFRSSKPQEPDRARSPSPWKRDDR